MGANPTHYSDDFISLTGQVSYTFQNNITLYTDGGLLDGSRAGVRYTLDDETRLSVFRPLLLGTSGEIWKDLYLVGQNRKAVTSELDTSIGFSIENILGSYASIEYVYQNLSIKDDRAEKSLNHRLTSNEINQLRRSYKSHYIATSVPLLDFGNDLYLLGGASYTRADAKGRANNFTAYHVDLTLVYDRGNVEVFGNLLSGKNKYQSINPVFRAKRRDDFNSISAGIAYKEPFDWKDVSLELLVARERNNSNINFYDSRNDLIATSIIYHY